MLHVKVSHREARGNVFIPFHFREAAANLLTIDEIDPFGKIPEFKFCAVSIAPAGDRGRVSRRFRTVTVTANQQPAVPGVEACGQVRGPSLIPMLMEIQGRLGWLPREELEALAREQKRPLYEIQGLVSFYPHFRTEPPTGVTVRVCHDLTCWLNGAEDRIAQLHEQYGDAGDVEVVEISCPGRCDIAPAATVDEQPARLDDVDTLVDAKRSGDNDLGAVVAYGPEGGWPNDPYGPGEPRYQALRALLSGRSPRSR